MVKLALVLEPVDLAVDSQLTHQTWLHTSTDDHLIGVITFYVTALVDPNKPLVPTMQPSSEHVVSCDALPRHNTWDDIEYIRRRIDEFSIVGFPDFLSALIIDLSHLPFLLDADAPIFPWRMLEDHCPIRVLVHGQQRAHYSSVFEPAWLAWDLEHALLDLRKQVDEPQNLSKH